MSLNRKLGKGCIQLKSSYTTEEGTTITETEKWTGPHADLLVKLRAVFQLVKSTSLTPTGAGEGELTIVRETVSDNSRLPKTVTLEVIWQELRLPIEQHPHFASLTPQEIRIIQEGRDDGLYAGFPFGDDGCGEALAKMYQKHLSEYNTGVPVVRRTTTKQSGNLAAGNAWFRDTPPIDVPGGWDWLKSADDRRREGKSYTQIEEWIGGKKLDDILYP